MDTSSVWEMLSNLTVGTVVAWILVIAAIISTISVGAIKLYKVFQRFQKVKDEDTRQRDLLAKHEEMLENIQKTMDNVNESMEGQLDVDTKILRHILIRTCEDMLAAGQVSEAKMRSTEEIYAEYTNVLHGNGYVTGLVERVRKLALKNTIHDINEE